MKIDSIMVGNAYRSNRKNSIPAKTKPPVAKTDTIAFSARPNVLDTGKLVSNIAASVEGSVSDGKLEVIKMAIESGQYSVSSDKLADAILNTII